MSGKDSKPETAPAEGRGGPDYDELVQAIYESALNPESWRTTLDQLRIHLDASAFNLIGFKLTDYANPFLLSHNISTDYGKDYQAYWGERDIWVQAARDKNLAAGGQTLAGGMLVERRELVRGEFYNDWLVNQNIGDVLCSNLWDAEPDTPHVVLCYFRGVGSEGFDEADRLKLQSVSRHLNRAFRIAFRLGLLERGRALNESVVAGLSQAVFVLDAGCRILHCNPAAQRLLDACPAPVKMRHGRVIGLGTRACPDLDEALNLADHGRHTRIAFTHARPGEAGETLSAVVAPLGEVSTLGLPSLHARYLLVIENCRGINEDSLRSFCGLFHLTAAEQSVLVGLMDEATPEVIAATLRVSVATVRSHIQHIRQKTGVRRLTELVRIALAASRAP
ncbi:helix-turn-helix transcriptional regulator [Methylococcus mesophilus]|uniref:helix-turn-helix transcriptional regulator n=1 Tax=Methylococcus mesophilus TaxID=2993564 RepID=UPI00224A93FD|nr:helix-turn-helix transcriptional regulator [Methylococcus mesophilus]UZR27135.1 helix-turn-helix transcriptional regulator [Methylococcus mesophilus]